MSLRKESSCFQCSDTSNTRCRPQKPNTGTRTVGDAGQSSLGPVSRGSPCDDLRGLCGQNRPVSCVSYPQVGRNCKWDRPSVNRQHTERSRQAVKQWITTEETQMERRSLSHFSRADTTRDLSPCANPWLPEQQRGQLEAPTATPLKKR